MRGEEKKEERRPDVWQFRRERGKLEFEKEGGDKLANFLFVLSGGRLVGETRGFYKRTRRSRGGEER